MTWKASIILPSVDKEFVVIVDVLEEGFVMDGTAVMDDGERFFLLFYKKDPSGKAVTNKWNLGSFAKGKGPSHIMSVIVLADRVIKAHDRKEVMNGHA